MATRFSDALPRDLRYEPTSKRIRAEFAGEVVADTTQAVLVWEPDHVVPIYAFPAPDVRTDRLTEVESAPLAAHGDRADVFTIARGDRVAESSIWRYADEDLSGYLAFDWKAMDRWLEEEEEVIGHPRDPFHRVDVRASSRHVHVGLAGETLADSHRPTLVFETGLPTRYYLPPGDVRTEALQPTETQSICAYKGRAAYWSIRIADTVEQDAAWTYRQPLPDNDVLQDLICFFNEKVDITVDGEPVGRPDTQWSPR